MDVEIGKNYGRYLSKIFDGKKYTQEETEDILFNGITLPQIAKISEIIQEEKFQVFLKYVWNSKENKIARKREIPNSAIDLNNKIVELIHYYQDKGFSFYEEIKKSSLARVMVEDLFSSYNKTCYCLTNARKSINEIGSISELKLNIDEYENLGVEVRKYMTNMLCYQNVSDRELWRYDIENDAVGSVLKEYFNCEDKGKFVNHLSVYISDMKKLRIK